MKKKTPKQAKSKYKLSADEIALFHDAVAAIRPKVRENTPESRELPALQDHWPETVSADDNLFFAKPGVQRQDLRRLRQGQIPIEDVLDLHGKTVNKARAELAAFIQAALREEYRLVKIIHGKSSLTSPTPPVLKNYVNGWLQQLPAVLAFCSALPHHGGKGAVYVLLR